MTTVPMPVEIRSIYHRIEGVPGLALDLQGWNSNTPLFRKVIEEVRPKVVVEVGVWKGASLIHMAKICREMGLDTLFYAVDVFYGLKGMMIGDIPRTQIPRPWDSATLYQQFLFNVKHEGFDGCVIPVIDYSRFSAYVLRQWGVAPDLVYIDAAHDEHNAYADNAGYWEILRPGGVMFGDDFGGYDGVAAAVRRFSLDVGVPFSLAGEQWVMKKP